MFKKSKRKFSQLNQAYGRCVKSAVKKVGDMIDEKFHTREKLDAMNSWATEHPRMFFRYTLIASFVILVGGAIPSLFSGHDKDFMNLDDTTREIKQTSNLIDGIRQIESRKSVQQDLTGNLLKEIVKCRDEIDSISKLESLSHDDSVRLVMNVRKFQIFSNNLKSNEKD